MNWVKLAIWYCSFITIVFGADYLYTKFFVPIKPIKISESHDPLRVRHSYFSHTLLSNFQGTNRWGEKDYKICTNTYGFKDKCQKLDNNNKIYDVAFIGDSFTEAIGMAYEESFVGKFAAQYPNLKVANLGVTGYAPSVYLKKIQWYLDKGLKFDHLIVFIDISDIQDEAIKYSEASDGSINYSYAKDKQEAEKFANSIPVKVKTFVKKNFYFFSLAYIELKNRFSNNKYGVFNHWKFSPLSEWTYNTESSEYGDMGVLGAIEKTKNYMRRLDVLLKAKNIKLSIAVYPHPAQLKETSDSENLQVKIWREFCKNRCEIFINTFPEFYKEIAKTSAEEVYEKFYILGDVHYNELGNSLIFSVLNKNYEKYIFSKQKEL